MHDLLQWEYHSKLWMLDHPLTLAVPFILVAIAARWINRP